MPAIDAREQEEILGRLLEVLPESCGLVLLGNTAGIRYSVPGVTTTKDVDVSVVVLEDALRIAPRERIDEILNELGVEPTVYPEDRSWVQAELQVGDVARAVDFIRGRKRNRPNGTFIHRDILNRIVAAAQRDGRVLVPSLTDLILMKAWAATDQARLATDREGKARSEAQRRRRAYEEDTRRYTEAALDRDVLDLSRLEELLGEMRDHREPEVRGVLERAGTLEPDSGGATAKDAEGGRR